MEKKSTHYVCLDDSPLGKVEIYFYLKYINAKSHVVLTELFIDGVPSPVRLDGPVTKETLGILYEKDTTTL